MFSAPAIKLRQEQVALNSSRRPLIIWLALIGGAFIWIGLIIGAPIIVSYGHGHVADFIYHVFSPFCHQIPERSYFIFGHKFAVCSRCFGIYAGFTSDLLLYPAFRPLTLRYTPERKWLVLASIPMGLDFALGSFHLWSNTFLSRTITGGLFGFVSVLYILPGIIDLSSKRDNKDQVAGG